MEYYRLCYRSISQKTLEFFTSSNLLEEEEPGCGDGSSYQRMSSLVTNHDNDLSRFFWVILSSVFTIRSLQEKGYFGKKKLGKTKNQMLFTKDENLIAKISVKFLELMRYNTHGILTQVIIYSVGHKYPRKRPADKNFCNSVEGPSLWWYLSEKKLE